MDKKRERDKDNRWDEGNAGQGQCKRKKRGKQKDEKSENLRKIFGSLSTHQGSVP